MSDIPVGSPPVPPGRHAAPSGWYPDPVDPAQERYWDGWQWARTTRLSGNPPTTRSYRQHAQYPPAASGPPSPQAPYPQQPYAPAGYPQPSRARLYTADGVPVAGWWWRVLAVIIDNLIVGVVSAAVAFPVYRRAVAAISAWVSETMAAAQAGRPAPAQPGLGTFFSASDQLLLLASSFVVEMIFLVAFWRWKAATPGKLVAGLRIVPVDQGRNTAPLPWPTVIIRALVWVLPGLYSYLILVRLLDALFPLWHPKRQALHDLAAKTQVVKIN